MVVTKRLGLGDKKLFEQIEGVRKFISINSGKAVRSMPCNIKKSTICNNLQFCVYVNFQRFIFI